MKKCLLLSTMLAASMYVGATDMTYSLSGDEFSGFGLSTAGCNYSAAIEVPADVAATMTGSKVTEVSIGFHSGMAKVATIYMTYDLEGEPFFEQQVKPLKAGQYNSFTLTTPYSIEGKKFYIGYTYRASTASGTPIGFDDSNGPGNPAFSHIAAWTDKMERTWTDGSKYGNLALRATISGSNFPSVSAIPASMTLPQSVSPGKEFTYTLNIRNLSDSKLESVEVTTLTADGDPMTTKVNINPPIAAGAEGSVKVNGISNIDTLELPVAGAVTKANGNDNPWASYPVTAITVSSDNVFPRIVVAEEYTGTYCGWCPRGIVSLELLNKTYPETFIGIEAHTYTASDPMYCPSYNAWTNRYAQGAPFMLLNRTDGFSPDPGSVGSHYLAQAGLVRYKVEPEAEYADNTHKLLKVTTHTSFGDNFPDNDFALAFVIIENNVGPYYQSNNYAGSSNQMGGWESAAGTRSWIYTGVAREIFDWEGRPGTIPSDVKQGQTYDYDTTLPIAAPSGKSHANTEIVALLINRTDGSIMTAGKCKIKDAVGAVGINTTLADLDATVNGGTGTLEVSGQFDTAEIFTASGLRAATLSEAGSISIPAGIYLVRISRDGHTATSKVMVR